MASQTIMTKNDINQTQKSLADQVIKIINHPEDFLVIGIQRRGAILAERLAYLISEKLNKNITTGSLDINLYRDDWSFRSGGNPVIGNSRLPFTLENKEILLVDDVLFSGRTVRAALEALFDYGRPAWIKLLAFIDRGHRELPVCADFVGKYISTKKNQRVDVYLTEQDGKEEITLS